MATVAHFSPAWMYRNGDVQTCFPSLFRGAGVPLAPQRTVLELADGDILLLDWYSPERERVAVIAHGLEGDSERYYVAGMVRRLHEAGWGCLAWNFRGCGGEPNRLPQFTHNGSWQEVEAVVEHALGRTSLKTLALIGFSMGGNLNLNYLCHSGSVPSSLCATVNFSVPIDLRSCAEALARRRNWIYMHRFVISMQRRMRRLAEAFPGTIDVADMAGVRTFADFDERYTAPLHGFSSAEEYWERCSSRPHLAGIAVRTLIVNALDDPFLGGTCYSAEGIPGRSMVTIETPRHGGHCGFFERSPSEQVYWSEKRALEFLESVSNG